MVVAVVTRGAAVRVVGDSGVGGLMAVGRRGEGSWGAGVG